MSTQMCKVVVLALRCHTHRSRPCIRAVLAPKEPSGPCVVIPKRGAYSDALSSGPTWSPPGTPSQKPRAERTSPSSTLTQRNLSALQTQSRPLINRYDFLDVGAIEENVLQVKPNKAVRHYIVDPALAELVTQHLGPDLDNAKTAIFECNPGPGVLTRTLLNAGAQRLVVLENDKGYLPYLQELEGRLDGQLEVVHCDYFKLDPLMEIYKKPSIMTADKLFTDLGISEAKWTEDTPVKVVGILPMIQERGTLLKMVYALFERASVYRYGRIELFLFMSEHEYVNMMSRPGDMQKYRASSVLCQMAWDVKLLHKEPWESFGTTKQSSFKRKGKSKVPNNHLCLVHLRPRADLFSSGLNPSNGSTLVVMVKQVLAARKARLINKLNLWCPDSGSKLLAQMGMQEDILTGQVFPDEYRRLFELMEKSAEFKNSWLYEETPESTMINPEKLSWL